MTPEQQVSDERLAALIKFGAAWGRWDSHEMLLIMVDLQSKRRVLERHIRWRETALGFLKKVIDGRGTEDEWPELAEFVEASTTRVVLASATQTEVGQKR